MKDVLLGLIKKAIEAFLTDKMVDDFKKMVVAQLRELALKTDNELDDTLVDIIEKALK